MSHFPESSPPYSDRNETCRVQMTEYRLSSVITWNEFYWLSLRRRQCWKVSTVLCPESGSNSVVFARKVGTAVTSVTLITITKVVKITLIDFLDFPTNFYSYILQQRTYLVTWLIWKKLVQVAFVQLLCLTKGQGNIWTTYKHQTPSSWMTDPGWRATRMERWN